MKSSSSDLSTMFSPGQAVVYPSHGVGRVTSIETQRVADQEMKVLVINFAQDGMTLRVPLHKVKTSGLRAVLTRQAMDAALKVLKEPAGQSRLMWNRQAVEYATKINSGDPKSLAEVVRDLHPTAATLDQSHSKRAIYEQALSRLVHEVAAIDSIRVEDATIKLGQFLNAA